MEGEPGKQHKDLEVWKDSWVCRSGTAGWVGRLRYQAIYFWSSTPLCCNASPFFIPCWGCPCTQTDSQQWWDRLRCWIVPGRGRGTVSLPQRGGLCLSRLHCSLLQGKEAGEEAALGVVKETESEGEEGPSRGETAEQVSISPPRIGAFFLWGQGRSSAAAQPSRADTPGWGWGSRGAAPGPAAPVEGPGSYLPSCLLELKGLEEVLGGTRLSFPGVFRLAGKDPGVSLWGFAFLQSREAGAWGSCCLRAPVCLRAGRCVRKRGWSVAGFCCLARAVGQAGGDTLTCAITLLLSPAASRGFHLNDLTSFLPQTFESGTRPEEI